MMPEVLQDTAMSYMSDWGLPEITADLKECWMQSTAKESGWLQRFQLLMVIVSTTKLWYVLPNFNMNGAIRTNTLPLW